MSSDESASDEGKEVLLEVLLTKRLQWCVAECKATDEAKEDLRNLAETIVDN